MKKKANGPNRSEAGDTQMDRRLYDIGQTSIILGVSRWTVRRLINDGTLSVVVLRAAGSRSIRRLLIDSIDLNRLIERSKTLENRS